MSAEYLLPMAPTALAWALRSDDPWTHCGCCLYWAGGLPC